MYIYIYIIKSNHQTKQNSIIKQNYHHQNNNQHRRWLNQHSDAVVKYLILGNCENKKLYNYNNNGEQHSQYSSSETCHKHP